MPKLSDSEALPRWFVELADTAKPQLQRLIGGRSLDKGIVDEAIQEVLLRALERSDGRPPRSWVDRQLDAVLLVREPDSETIRMARSVFLTVALRRAGSTRRKSIRQATISERNVDAIADRTHGSAPDPPDVAAERKAVQRALLDAIESLSPDDQDLLARAVLVDVEPRVALTAAERTRLSRLRKRLRSTYRARED